MVINPNTSESMTRHIQSALEKIKRPDTGLTVVCAGKGPETIESAYDEAMADPGLVHSKLGLFSTPPEKPFMKERGKGAGFLPGARVFQQEKGGKMHEKRGTLDAHVCTKPFTLSAP